MSVKNCWQQIEKKMVDQRSNIMVTRLSLQNWCRVVNIILSITSFFELNVEKKQVKPCQSLKVISPLNPSLPPPSGAIMGLRTKQILPLQAGPWHSTTQYQSLFASCVNHSISNYNAICHHSQRCVRVLIEVKCLQFIAFAVV